MNMDVEDPKEESLLIDSKEESLRINHSTVRMNIPDLDISGENLPTQTTSNDASFEAAIRERSLTSHPQLRSVHEEAEQNLVDPILLAQLNQTSKDD